jgi:two-component system CheB/CheR fusion protein
MPAGSPRVVNAAGWLSTTDDPSDRKRGEDTRRTGWTIEIKKTLAPKRVLVIEDNLDAVRTTAYLLYAMGHKVEYAVDGHAGLDAALRFRPDFVLLDLGLPGIDGFEVCRRIKLEPGLQHTRVIAITAYAEEEYRVKSKAAGCEMHLVKPVPMRVLEELLG